MMTQLRPATAMAPPASWVPVNSTKPCEQTSTLAPRATDQKIMRREDAHVPQVPPGTPLA
jgi:hypothetical protein